MFAAAHPTALEAHTAVVLIITFAFSLLYEIWRATAKAGTSRHDSWRVALGAGIPLYGLAAAVIWLLLAGVSGAAWIALAFCLIGIALSVGYYNPVVMPDRQPGLLDWVEDLAYTGLLFVAAALLAYQVLGWSLVVT